MGDGGAGRPGRPGRAWLRSYRTMAGGVGFGLGDRADRDGLNPQIWPLTLPFALLWLAAPALAERISRPGTRSHRPQLGDRCRRVRCG